MKTKLFNMEILGKVLAIAAVIVLMAVLFSVPTMLLWNWLMPKLFGLVTIGFWEALGIALLSGILFRGSSSTSKSDK